MPSLADRVEFAPPPPANMLRALGWAVLVHLLLVAALTWGVNWRSQDSRFSAEAELWASVPQAAAPSAAVVPQGEPIATPPAAKPPAALPPEPAAAPPKAATPPAKPPTIATEREKPLNPPPPVTPVQAAKPPPAPTTPAQASVDPAAAKALEAKKKAAQDAQKQEAQTQAAQQAQQREENLRRMAGLAGATGTTGAPSATGTANRSAGPSDSYGGRVKARVKPNIVFTGDASANPRVEVEVRSSPDGTILGRPRIVKSSGNREWDEAVVRAFEKTEVLPRDVNGSVPSPLLIGVRPSD